MVKNFSSEKLSTLFIKVFGLETGQSLDNFNREDNEEWDSFNHFLLISEIERESEIKFTIDEVQNVKSFTQLAEMIDSKA